MLIPQKFVVLAVSGIFSSTLLNAQIVGANAYLIGEYIEIGVDQHGCEGTDDLPGSNSRGGACAGSFFGYVANPQMDGWVNYDGDFFTPGTPENGFGLDIGGLEFGNNATPCGTGLYEIPGSITDFWETADSVCVTWQGNTSGVDVVVIYELQKNEVHYTTKVMLANSTASPITNVYYYRNVDPDNNQSIGWGFPTTNTIVAQMTSSTDCCAIVEATDVDTWTATMALEAFDDTMWRCSYGGFSNRDGSEIWNGIGYTLTEGASATGDVAISLARKIEVLPTGKSAPVTFSYRVRFGDGTYVPPIDPTPDPADTVGYQEPGGNEGEGGTQGGGTGDVEELENADELIVYPNPNTGEFSIQHKGDFYFMVSDQRGRLVVDGLATDATTLDISSEAAGTYFVKVRQNGKFRVEPIVLE